MIFFNNYFFSSMTLISSKSWLSIWFWLEINLTSFIAFLMMNNKNKMSNESSLIYFLIQTISSIILLFSINMMMFLNNFFNLLILSIMMKLGSAPFHYWLPLIIEGLNWFEIFLMLTWQKINPLFMLIVYNNYNNLKLFIILSLVIGSITGLNYISLKKIISFSSINQLSWMMMSLMNNKLFKIYLLFYSMIMFMIIKSFNIFNLKFLNQLFNLNLKNKFLKLFMFMNLLSLGGLPPFLGFFPKLFIIMKMNNSLMMFFMILFTLISLFMYLRILFSLLMLNSLKINKIKMFKNKIKIKNLMNISLLNNFLLIIFLMIN